MASKALKDKFEDRIKQWPTKPGVYLMRDVQGRILYVGKAKSLRARIRSYFQSGEKLNPKTVSLMRRTHQLEYTVTNTELEAILLECNLIKKHRPRYNIRLRDDKNFPYFVLDFKHDFPQFKITRRVKAHSSLRYYGPYSAGVRDLSRFLLKTFQIRDCSDAKFKNRTRPCLNYEIGTCTAPCVDYVDVPTYAKQVEEAVLFLSGKNKQLVKSLKAQMESFSKKQHYEQARVYRDKIISLEKITAQQDAVLGQRAGNIDVIGAYFADGEIQWVILYIRAGYLTGKRSYRVKTGVESSKEEVVRSFVAQVYTRALVPDEIWVSSDFPDRRSVELVLSGDESSVKIKPARSEQAMRLLAMAEENAKLTYLEHKKKKSLNASEELRKVLSLKETPISIEGIDISNLQDSAPVGSLVHFEDGVPIKARYRMYYPRSVEGQDDFAMIYETVLRRFQNKELGFPDLLLIDGGKGQLGAAVKACEELELDIPICSLAKARTDSGFSLKEVERSEERIFVPGRKNPIILRETNPALRLLQQVRDEAHRFGVSSHRKRREKELLDSSPVQSIAGIGKKTKEKLLRAFGDLEKIKEASLEEIKALGISAKVAERLKDELSKLKKS